MPSAPVSKPTPNELEILRVLWERGPSTVREVHETLSAAREVGYTTVLKVMQIMTVKGMVRRNEESRAHIYQACQPAEKTKQQLVSDLLHRAFAGSASQLMMHALAGKKSPEREIEEIRRMLDQYEARRKS
jgi:BlaI family transcriptional regulator, penicillinase repressor